MGMNKKIQEVIDSILEDYLKGRDVDKTNVFDQPDGDVIEDILRKLMMIVFPGYYREKSFRGYNYNNRMSVIIEDISYNLKKQITIALNYHADFAGSDHSVRDAKAEELVLEFMSRIPKIRSLVDTDLQAFYDGDPAAESKEIVVLSYPGFRASTTYRLAHELFLMKVPLIPRMMTEIAHSATGIDIHPGATIGKYFFMDHGTGIVVGETSIIGEHVKVYQGVTIGALSTRGGQKLKGVKRHPTIEDNVTIYANAAILGGETVIGEGSIIGGNAFITSSVDENSRVSNKTQELQVTNSGDVKVKKEEDPTEETWFYII